MAPIITPRTPTTMLTMKGMDSFVSVRVIGLRTALPAESFGPNDSGAWTTTFSAKVGMVMTVLHFGHGPFLPANCSLTWKRVLQPGHVMSIGMENLEIRRGFPDLIRRNRRIGSDSNGAS